jgi:hypothetical protein
VDRIAEPWGTRTPYGRGEPLPIRVAAFAFELEDQVSDLAREAGVRQEL